MKKYTDYEGGQCTLWLEGQNRGVEGIKGMKGEEPVGQSIKGSHYRILEYVVFGV